MKCEKYKNRKTKTRWHLDEWGDLNPHQLRQKLLERMVSSEDVQKRYWKKVDRRSDEECWNWIGAFWPDGYGMLMATIGKYGKRWMGFRAPRIAFLIQHKELPDDMFVCHHCDNEKCVNPKHLFLGKQLQNMQDKVMKGRQAFGESHGRCKLTVEQVQEIRRLHFLKGISPIAIANTFPVKKSTIRSLIIGRNWKWLPFPDDVENPYSDQ